MPVLSRHAKVDLHHQKWSKATEKQTCKCFVWKYMSMHPKFGALPLIVCDLNYNHLSTRSFSDGENSECMSYQSTADICGLFTMRLADIYNQFDWPNQDIHWHSESKSEFLLEKFDWKWWVSSPCPWQELVAHTAEMHIPHYCEQDIN